MAPNSEDPLLYGLEPHLISFLRTAPGGAHFQVDKHHEKAKLSKVHPGGSEQSGVNIFTRKKKKERKFNGNDTNQWE